MDYAAQRQLCNGKLNYKIYYYDHDIRGYLICSSHKFSPFGRVGHLTFCYCYWQFVVSFLLNDKEEYREGTRKRYIEWERDSRRGISWQFMWTFGLALWNTSHYCCEAACANIFELFSFQLQTHTHIPTSIYTHTHRHRDTHTRSQCCDWHGAEINWIAISHMKWSFVNEHNNWGWSVGSLAGGLDNARRLRRACPCAVCQMAA